MKDFYEGRSKHSLLRRTYTVIRVDGKAFHTYTRGLNTPFDEGFIEDMDSTAAFLCKNIQGAKLAYVQSDEISVLLTDFDTLETDMWFDGNLQKMASVAASLATSEFNRLRVARIFKEYDAIPGKLEANDILSLINGRQANFDARAFQIPARMEVMNYFIWRQQDATRNSVSAVAQSLYSHRELDGKTSNEKQEMIFAKSGINWNDYPSRQKRGGIIEKVEEEVYSPHAGVSKLGTGPGTSKRMQMAKFTVRSRWKVVECPIFTQGTYFLGTRVPSHKTFNEAESLEK